MSPAEVTEMIMKYGKAYEKRMRIKPVAMAIDVVWNSDEAIAAVMQRAGV